MSPKGGKAKTNPQAQQYGGRDNMEMNPMTMNQGQTVGQPGQQGMQGQPMNFYPMYMPPHMMYPQQYAQHNMMQGQGESFPYQNYPTMPNKG